jgi:hypothetical protein
MQEDICYESRARQAELGSLSVQRQQDCRQLQVKTSFKLTVSWQTDRSGRQTFLSSIAYFQGGRKPGAKTQNSRRDNTDHDFMHGLRDYDILFIPASSHIMQLHSRLIPNNKFHLNYVINQQMHTKTTF